MANTIPDWLGMPPHIAQSEISCSLWCDILVLGSGNSGVCAARKAAELGAKVVVMEKMSAAEYRPLGTDMAYVNPKCYLEQGGDPIDPIEVLNEWQRRSYNRSDPALIRQYVLRSGECCDWIRAIVPHTELEEFSVYHNYPNGRDRAVMEISGYKSFPGAISYRDFNNVLGAGHNNSAWPRILSYSIKRAREIGAEWLWATEAVVLTQNKQGDVTGAVGKTAEGEYIEIKARKGVILATGDYSGNGPMVSALNHEIRELAEIAGQDLRAMLTKVTSLRNGIGHRMGIWAGGVMEPGPRASVNFGNGIRIPSMPMGGNYPAFGNDGKRFCNESIVVFGGQGHMMRRPAGERICCITDAKWEENLRHQGYEHNTSSSTCPRENVITRTDMQNYKPGPEGFDVHEFTCERMHTQRIFAADTLEELADYMGYIGANKQGLLAEIEKYNQMCHQGKDTDWGRDPGLLNPIETPPFFGSVTVTRSDRIMTGMVQLSGLMVNSNQQVRRKDGSLIGGLFAIGNCCGGRYAVQYPTPLAGNSIGIATTLGMVAGEYIAGLKPRTFQ